MPVFQEQINRISSNALLTFDGKELTQWEETEWYIEDGHMIVEPGAGGITSKVSFGVIQLYVEWRIPNKSEAIDGAIIEMEQLLSDHKPVWAVIRKKP